jgi:hypothetical protein
MKTIILKGQEIKIGSQVRFMDDRHLYADVKDVIKPVVGQVYTVRGFTDLNGFLLEEVKNINFEWTDDNGDVESVSEPGFAIWRFEPATPLGQMSIDEKALADEFSKILEQVSKTIKVTQ